MDQATETNPSMSSSAGARDMAATGSPVLPVLWNPTAAANFSVLITPIIGAWVQAKNWETLGKANEAKVSMGWAYAGIGVFVLSFFLPHNPWLLYLVLWYVISGRKQMKYVKAELNGQYQKKSWKEPLKYALMGYAAVVVLLLCGAGIESLLKSEHAELEQESVKVVDQIIRENEIHLWSIGLLEKSSEVPLPSCKKVSVIDRIGENRYVALASLTDGQTWSILIENGATSLDLNLLEGE